jgi:hypothetical protein
MKKLMFLIAMIVLCSCNDSKMVYPSSLIAGKYICDINDGFATDRNQVIEIKKDADNGFINFTFSLNNDITVRCVVSGENNIYYLNVVSGQNLMLNDGTGVYYKCIPTRYIETKNDGTIYLNDGTIVFYLKITSDKLGTFYYKFTGKKV